jgi:hypothetical protein
MGSLLTVLIEDLRHCECGSCAVIELEVGPDVNVEAREK